MVWSNDWCSFEPVLDLNTIMQGDIVFCEVQPGNRYFARKVKDIFYDSGKRYFNFWVTELGNQTPRNMKGWCEDHHIHGRLIVVYRTQT